jgi:hypothetical protein
VKRALTRAFAHPRQTREVELGAVMVGGRLWLLGLLEVGAVLSNEDLTGGHPPVGLGRCCCVDQKPLSTLWV